MREREREEREEITRRKWNSFVNPTGLSLSSNGSHWERGCNQILSLTASGDQFRKIHLTFNGSLGNDFSFEHWERSSVSRDFKLSMLLGRHSRREQ